MEIQKKWFAESAPLNAKGAVATMGEGTNGVVTITCKQVGTAGNEYKAEIVVAEGNSKAMTAVFADNMLTVTLGTNSSGEVDNDKNTAILIATEISKLAQFTATKSGSGATSITAATEEDIEFEGGQYGTFCPVPYTFLKDDNYYYTNIAPNGTHDANWRRFTLDNY